MDWELASRLEGALVECRFDPDALGQRLSNSGIDVAEDILRLLHSCDQ